MNVPNINNIRSTLKSSRSNSRGFTIVELLIVVVIIGILAAIVIVAYNGVTNRAKASKSQAAAALVAKKAHAYNGLKGSYPVGLVATTGFDATSTGANDISVSLQGSNVTFAALPTSGTTGPTNENTIEYIPCTTPAGGGARIVYWDYSASTPAKKTQDIGACTTLAAATLTGGAY